MDNVPLVSTAHADDICLLASSKEDLELMARECIAAFEAAGLETGMGNTFWTSTVRSPNDSLSIDAHSIPRAEKHTHTLVRQSNSAETADQR